MEHKRRVTEIEVKDNEEMEENSSFALRHCKICGVVMKKRSHGYDQKFLNCQAELLFF